MSGDAAAGTAGFALASRLDGLGLSLIRSIVAEAPADALSLAVGQVEADVPEGVAQALRDAPSVARAPYGPNAGLPAFREAVARAHGVSADRVIATTGVQQALALATFAAVEPGSDVLVPDPGFPTYATLARLAGGNPVAYTHDAAFRPTAAGLEAAWTDQTRAVVLASPANPTGAVADADNWHDMRQLARERGAWFISDEIYRPFGPYTQHDSALVDGDDGVLVCGGLSKAFAVAGWRIGWLIAPAAHAARIVALQQNLTTCAPSPTQQAALAAFTPEGHDAMRAIVEMVAARQSLAIQRLHEAGWTMAGSHGGLFVWARYPGVEDDLAFARHLATDGRVIVVPGRGFGATGHRWVRLSCGSADLDEGLSRLIASALRYPGDPARS